MLIFFIKKYDNVFSPPLLPSLHYPPFTLSHMENVDSMAEVRGQAMVDRIFLQHGIMYSFELQKLHQQYITYIVASPTKPKPVHVVTRHAWQGAYM